MVKREFMALVMLLALPVSQTGAQPIPVTVDGCARLARVIYAEVSSAATYGPGRAGPWVIDIGQGDLSVCSHAAKTVSQAFTLAMRNAGVDVRWGPSSGDTDGYCQRIFLSRCYPGRSPHDGQTFSATAKLVRQIWAAVSRAVMSDMYNPVSSDEVRFRDNDLKLRLGLSLRSLTVQEEVR